MPNASEVHNLRHAYKVAMAQCVDPSTQIGSLLVDVRGNVLVSGVNCFPYGIATTSERLNDREEKRRLVTHAEEKVIFAAARKGIRTRGLTLICTWYACERCARAIIEAGIIRVVGHDIPEYKAHPDWVKSVDAGMALLKEAGVDCDHYPQRLGDGLKVRVNFQEVEV